MVLAAMLQEMFVKSNALPGVHLFAVHCSGECGMVVRGSMSALPCRAASTHTSRCKSINAHKPMQKSGRHHQYTLLMRPAHQGPLPAGQKRDEADQNM